MTLMLAALFGIVFLELFMLLDLRREVVRIRDGSTDAFRMLASDASDDEKEAAMRRGSLRLFAATGLLLLKFLGIVAALALLYWGVVAIFPEREAALQASFVSPAGIAILTVTTALYAWVRHVAVKRL
ncbi:MAG TPA: hypothetical protein VJL86_10015 [Steroidobacteraceae bacterium]|nr:hypothetical protein [Steroidobacteraceae bacterium]